MTFFESFLYFASSASDPLPQPIPSSRDLKKQIVSKLLRCISNVPRMNSLLHSLLIQNLQLLILILLILFLYLLSSTSYVEMYTSAPSDLDPPIAHRKGKQSCTQHSSFNFVSCDRLTPLSHKFALSMSSISILRLIRKHCENTPRGG